MKKAVISNFATITSNLEWKANGCRSFLVIFQGANDCVINGITFAQGDTPLSFPYYEDGTRRTDTLKIEFTPGAPASGNKIIIISDIDNNM